jgi:hypothetical protein
MPNDFRSRRVKLRPEAFALSNGNGLPPTDLIEEDTWKSMTSLTDDVSLRTSDHFGTPLKNSWSLWDNWISIVIAIQEASGASLFAPLAHVAGDAVEYFQASIHNALVGYYRLAFASLRSVIENVAIGTQFQLSGDRGSFADWVEARERRFRFSWAADNLSSHSHIEALECSLRAATGDDLFHQLSRVDQGGFVRRFFATLSKYAHASPSYADGDIWESNGPVFVSGAFREWYTAFLTAYALGVLLVRLAQFPSETMSLGSPLRLERLFLNARAQLPIASTSKRIFDAIPATAW